MTESEAQDFEWPCTTEEAGEPFVCRGVDKHCPWDGKIVEQTVFSNSAPSPSARPDEPLEPMMRFLAADGTTDQER